LPQARLHPYNFVVALATLPGEGQSIYIDKDTPPTQAMVDAMEDRGWRFYRGSFGRHRLRGGIWVRGACTAPGVSLSL